MLLIKCVVEKFKNQNLNKFIIKGKIDSSTIYNIILEESLLYYTLLLLMHEVSYIILIHWWQERYDEMLTFSGFWMVTFLRLIYDVPNVHKHGIHGITSFGCSINAAGRASISAWNRRNGATMLKHTHALSILYIILL